VSVAAGSACPLRVAKDWVYDEMSNEVYMTTDDKQANQDGQEGKDVTGPKKLSPAVVEAIRAEFRALVEGDLDDNVTMIESLAARTRDLFLALKGGEGMRGRGPAVASMSNWSQGAVYPMASNMLPASPNVEQFGASFVRQLADNLPEAVQAITEAIMNSPTQQVAAIASARKLGMDDVAQQLQERMARAAPPASAEPPALPPHEHVNGSNGTPVTTAPLSGQV
jgi:hypothetical protein